MDFTAVDGGVAFLYLGSQADEFYSLNLMWNATFVHKQFFGILPFFFGLPILFYGLPSGCILVDRENNLMNKQKMLLGFRPPKQPLYHFVRAHCAISANETPRNPQTLNNERVSSVCLSHQTLQFPRTLFILNSYSFFPSCSLLFSLNATKFTVFVIVFPQIINGSVSLNLC